MFIFKANVLVKDIKYFLTGYGISGVPILKDRDGKDVPKLFAEYLLVAHDRVYSDRSYHYEHTYDKPGTMPELKEILDHIDKKSLQEFLLSFTGLLGKTGYSKNMFLVFPICRYADEETMRNITAMAPKWRSSVSGIDAPPLKTFREANMYSNTQSAMLFAERYHELDKYASIRGMTEDTLRDKYLSDIGLDEQGGKTYDLGNQTVVARLQKDLSFVIELQSGKTAKSLPKKGADTEKYQAANEAFGELKKSAKKVLKSRCSVLFEEFLNGKTHTAQAWKESYMHNPLLRTVAEIIVWSQGKNSFVLTDEGAVDCHGQQYDITDDNICVAHPIEMDAETLSAWRDYFAEKKIKQPFEQVWEAAVDPSSIKEDRYKGCPLPFYYFRNRAKHGIAIED